MSGPSMQDVRNAASFEKFNTIADRFVSILERLEKLLMNKLSEEKEKRNR